MYSQWYKLVDKKPVLITDMNDLEEVYKDGNRIMGRTKMPKGGMVSTVFLCLDHRYDGEGDPIVFETMYFPNWEDGDMAEQDCRRYCTYEDALRGHWEMVEQYGGVKPVEVKFDDDLFEI